jgi:hypothetical protein
VGASSILKAPWCRARAAVAVLVQRVASAAHARGCRQWLTYGTRWWREVAVKWANWHVGSERKRDDGGWHMGLSSREGETRLTGGFCFARKRIQTVLDFVFLQSYLPQLINFE